MPKRCQILRTSHDPERVDISPQIDLVEKQRQRQIGWNHADLFLVARGCRDERISERAFLATASRQECEGQRDGDGARLGEDSLLWPVTLGCEIAECARLTDHILVIGRLLPESNEAARRDTALHPVHFSSEWGRLSSAPAGRTRRDCCRCWGAAQASTVAAHSCSGRCRCSRRRTAGRRRRR